MSTPEFSADLSKREAEEMAAIRRIEPRPFPIPHVITVNGEHMRCYGLHGWRDLGHIDADYRALLEFTQRYELRLLIAEKEARLIRAQAEGWKIVALDANKRIERAETQARARNILPWILGGGIAIETIGFMVFAFANAH